MGTTLGPRYILYSYMDDPLGGWQGLWLGPVSELWQSQGYDGP